MRPLQSTAVAKIEAGDRRVDVDDLAVLALALNVSPARLLVPDLDPGEVIALTPARHAPVWSIWQWATGAHPLVADDGGDDLRDTDVQRRSLDFMTERPTWLRAIEAHPLARAIAHLQWAGTKALESHSRNGAWSAGPSEWLATARRAAAGVESELQAVSLKEADDAAR